MTNERFYLPGSNANIFSVRRERNYDPMGNAGNGEISQVEMTAKQAFHLKKERDALLKVVRQISNGGIDSPKDLATATLQGLGLEL